MKNELSTELPVTSAQQSSGLSRRRFFGLTGGLVAAGALLDACSKEPNNSNAGINLGSGDIGVLNYAFALEQLEAAFYTRVIESPFSGITATENALLTDIRDHEVAHREFFRKALSGNAIQDLQVNFSSIDFGSRESVLATAKAFEDLGVSAYNGAGKLITSPDYLLLAGKIVSVEARHAAYIRDLISNGSFADNTVIDMNGLDKSREPNEVLAIASAYLISKLNANNLPKS